MNGVHDAKRLAELTALPLERKIQISQTRIIEWYTHYNGNVHVSFSGGKDSTVLLHLVRQLFPDVKAVFSNTGLEYPEIRQFAMSNPNVDVVQPSMRFDQVISKYGYPIIGKEVAEAIHYARKIRSQNDKVERERERGSGENCLAKENGAYGKQAEWKRMEVRGGGAQNLIQTGNARNRRTVLQGKWGAGVAKQSGGEKISEGNEPEKPG